MTYEQKRTAEELALERHLEIHGADETRWPQEKRERFAPLLASDARARGLLAEARALDHLLDLAPLPTASRERAIRDRIVAAISAQKDCVRTAQPAAGVIELPARRQRTRATPAAPAALWPAAALFAASLAIGVYLGLARGLTPEVRAVAEVVGLETQPDRSQLSLLDDSASTGEEDLL
jgi:hypothetical protein